MRYDYIIRFFSILFIGLVGFLSTVNAAPGYLDPTFSQDGIAGVKLGSGGDDSGYATAVQPDGKIVVAGKGTYGFPATCLVTRFNPDGSFDASFNGDGRFFLSQYLRSGCYALAIQPDGKIVAVGTAGANGSNDFTIMLRLNANGALDTTFDSGGIKLMTEGAINALAVQSDGKIVIANSTYNMPADFELTRFSADGSLDTSFDGDGRVRTPIGNFEESARAIFIQADGKIIAAGNIFLNPGYEFAVARYNSDGSLDTTFDGDGKVITTMTSRVDFVTSVAVHATGKIAVAGYSGSDHGIFALAVYNANGSLDTTFDADGKVSTVLGTWDEAYSVAFQPDGKIIMAGSSISSQTISDLAIVRYNLNGSLDPTFDGDGKYILSNLPTARNAARSIALQSDGKIIAAGIRSHIISETSNNENSLLVRLNADGSLDTSFDTDGILDSDIAVESSGAGDAAIQADGKIVSTGYSYNNSRINFAVVRHNADGSLDTTFDADGIVETTLEPNSSGLAHSIVIQPDGKIIAAGQGNVNGGDFEFVLVRYNTNGSLDTTFGGDGIVMTSVLEYFDFANAVALQPDGKIVAAGYSNKTNGAEIGTLVRYNADGSLDTTFGSGGKVRTAAANEIFNSLAIQTDGKIVVAGQGGFALSNGFTLYRYNQNGSLDTTFGNSGKVTTPNTGPAYDVALQTDGKIVAAGYSYNGSYDDIALARYNPNGSLDTTFDGDGKVVTSIGSSSIAYSVVVQSDGKIIAAGSSAIVRYNSNGSPDNSYGVGGRTILNNFGVGAIALDQLGRAVLAGSTESAFFAVARLVGDASSSRTRFDFDDDGKTDISVFRPSNGTWYIQQSTVGFTALRFGMAGDKLVPADYDGDGKTDVAVFRNGLWYLQRSQLGFTAVRFGDASDIPVPADYDGDGKADLAVFRPSSGVWYLQQSTAGFSGFAFGQNGDQPVPADYDGDGSDDLAVYRGGIWYIFESSTNALRGVQFGIASDKPLSGDFDGDGKNDLAVVRQNANQNKSDFYILRSFDNGFNAVTFGTATDIPAVGDYDGDGKADIAVFRPSNGAWYLNRSTAGFIGVNFGQNGDQPIPAAFVP